MKITIEKRRPVDWKTHCLANLWCVLAGIVLFVAFCVQPFRK